MSRVDWGAYPGEDVEQVIAVLLLQNGLGWHRKPGQGDHGVDVVKPIDTGRAYEVFQIKSFTGPLEDGSRKAQITKSYKAAAQDPKLPAPMAAWHLVLPRDLTEGEEEWFFETLTKDASFACDWLGLTHVERLASEFPHVTDWYFADGKARLETRLRDLANATDLLHSADTPLRADELVKPVESLLSAVNRDDPHYVYYFATAPHPPSGEEELKNPDPRIVSVQAMPLRDELGWFILRTFERYAGSSEDRPIGGTFSLRLPDSDERAERVREELEGAFRYGLAARVPSQYAERLELDMPTGSSSSSDFEIRISGRPEQDFEPFRLRFAVTDPTGVVVAETVVRGVERRKGGAGWAVELVDDGRAFALTALLDDPRVTSLEDSRMQLTGWRVSAIGEIAADALAGLQVLHHLHAPNSLRIQPDLGPEVSWGELPIEWEAIPVELPLVRLTEALAVLQRHTHVPLHIPEDLGYEDFAALLECAALLEGEPARGRWKPPTTLTIRGDGLDQVLQQGVGAKRFLLHETGVSLALPETTIEVGERTTVLESAKIASPDVIAAVAASDPRPEVVEVELAPGDSDAMVIYPIDPATLGSMVDLGGESILICLHEEAEPAPESASPLTPD